jgi:hypothetical protein
MGWINGKGVTSLDLGVILCFGCNFLAINPVSAALLQL